MCMCMCEGGYLKVSWGGYSGTSDLDGKKLEIWMDGGGGILNFRIGVFCRISTKVSTTPAGSCITDSLSHTMYVETNQDMTHIQL